MNIFRRPLLSLFLAGSVAVFALPPINILPLLFFSLGYFLWMLLEAKTVRQAFWRGCAFGFGYFLFGLYWISFALRLDWPTWAWLIPPTLVGLPLLLMLFIGLVGALLFVVSHHTSRPRITMIILFPLAWTGIEILRGHVFTGFPWNSIGIAYVDFAVLAQGAAAVGMYGLGFITCLIISLFFIARETPARKKYAYAAIIFIITTVTGFGAWRLHGAEKTAADYHVRIVQPNIGFDGKWDDENRQRRLDTLIALTTAPAATAPDLIVWPEAAAPYPIATAANARMAMAQSIPPQSILATGSVRRDMETGRLANSIEFMNADGDIVAHYDKSHLVPFGEYMPLPEWLNIPAVANIFGDLQTGNGPTTITLGRAAISPTICYEAIFPAAVSTRDAQIMVNVTDDGWYGNTAGPHQHLAQARMRSIEEGIPTIRAANTGISAIIDRYGRITAQIPYGQQAVLDGAVSLQNPAPPPAAMGGFYGWLAGLAVLATAAQFFMTRR